MGISFYFDWEVSLMEWLQGSIGGIMASVLNIFSMFGEELILVSLIGFLYWSWDKEFGKFVGINIVTTCVWNPLIKNVFLRRRPYFDNSSIKCLRPVESEADVMDITAQGFSFPSGHSMNAATVYPSLWVRIKKKWLLVVSILLPLLVGISRVYTGNHYPTDVIAGWGLGVIVVVVSSLLQLKISNKKLLYGIYIISGCPGMFYCKSSDYFTAYGMMVGFFLAFLVEERFVNFENTRNPIRMVIRVMGGLATFGVLNTVLKLPFSSEFLASGVYAALLVRFFRYAIVIFSMIALYPMSFNYIDRIAERRASRME